MIDAFYIIPSRVIDRTQDIDFRKLEKGQIITTSLKVKKHHYPFNPKLPYVIECTKGNLIINLIYFSVKGNFLRNKFPENKEFIVSGKVSFYKSNISIAHPDYIEEIENEDKLRSFENIYPLTRGIHLKDLRKIFDFGKIYIEKYEEWISIQIIDKFNFHNFHNSIIKLHFPENQDDVEKKELFRKRLAADELISNYFAIRYLKEKTKKKEDNLDLDFSSQNQLILNLPFKLTEKQKTIINEINSLNNSHYRETILLQGDVGSGKTIVSLLTAIPFILKGYQVAYMAPTEILASQIYENIINLIQLNKINPVLLTGSTKNKDEIYQKISNKEFDFIVGTHAIFQENLIFNQLKYVIIDEQHRFGVRQRLILGEKGINTNILLMSATPIPRTLALAQYGEIEQVVLNERPAFQRPIITKVSNSKKIKDLIIYLKKSISDKNQIYWICPLVEESENHEYKDVESRFKSLQKVFGSKVGLLHGKMKATYKENIINEFKSGKIGILVATTVIEVGIDNKNANTVVIENSEKFGLSQLHQLRGRVGRGNEQGYCFAIYGENITDTSKERLKVFKNNLDGFKLAEKDLEIRGTGDVLGYRQSGDSLFKFVNTAQDQELIIECFDYVKEVISSKKFEDKEFQQKIYQLLLFFKQHEAIKLLFSYFFFALGNAFLIVGAVGATKPAEIIYLIAWSTDIDSLVHLDRGTNIRKPVVGLGVEGIKTFIIFLFFLIAISPLVSLVRKARA